jgi:hypothetical protein
MSIALLWTTVEIILTTLAQWGYPHFVQGYLALPATRPASLSANVKMTLVSVYNPTVLQVVKHSASGWPDIDALGHWKFVLGYDTSY